MLPTHEDAPRVLISTAMVVPEWSDQDTFRRLEDAGLTMYGQMTAAGWFYIGTQGILGFTYETFRAIAAKHFGGSLSGRRVLTAGLGGMGGAQGFGVGLNGGRALIVEVDPARAERRLADGWVDLVAGYDDGARRASRSRGPGLGRARRQRGRCRPAPARRRGRVRRRHRPDGGARSAPRLRAARLLGGGGARGRRGGPGLPARGLRLAHRARGRAARLQGARRGRLRVRKRDPRAGRGAGPGRRHGDPRLRRRVRAPDPRARRRPLPLDLPLRRSRGPPPERGRAHGRRSAPTPCAAGSSSRASASRSRASPPGSAGSASASGTRSPSP